MRSTNNNPAANQLSQDIPPDLLEEAVKDSGYPLQTTAALKLMQHFVVTEEWGYIDRDSETKRALDLFCYRNFGKSERYNPSLALLIECKRSRTPYIFFKSVVEREWDDFPLITGLNEKTVGVAIGNTQTTTPIAKALGIAHHDFVKNGAIICNSFTKVGKRSREAIELSGEEIFKGIVLPLVSAMDHTYAIYRTSNREPGRSPVLTLGVCVIDAPIIVADATKAGNDLTLAPWVRVMRQEAHDRRNDGVVYEHYGIDIVHIGFLETFIEQHVLPFAEVFRDRVYEGII